MARRMTIVFLCLVNFLVALYLHLYKLGLVGALACTSGGCDRAMFSHWGWFLGLDVALIGVIGYTLLFITGLVSLQPRWQGSRGPVAVLLVLATLGFLFTLRLKYGEYLVLKTFCKWCAISAVSITLITILAGVELGALRRKAVQGPDA